MFKILKTGIVIILFIYFPNKAIGQDKAKGKILDNMIVEGMNDWQIPGLTAVVVKDQKVVFKKTYGVKNLENKEPINEFTLFNMGSTTKAVISMALGVLVDQGKLDWNDKVREHLPSFQLSDPYITEDARVQDLLTHNLGIEGANLLWIIDSVSTKNTISRFKHAQKKYPLRGGYEYNNLMYAVAGEVIGSVSGEHWTKFVKSNILDPLEMNHTKAKASELFDEGNYVTPYLNDIEDGIIEVNYNLSDQIGAAGMIWSCVNDIQKYLQFLTNDGVFNSKRILKKETFDYLFKPHALIPNSDFYPTQKLTKPNWISYGLGWFQHDYRGEKIDFHTGSIEGLVAIAGILHDKNIAVYVFANLDHAELRHAILYKAFDLFAFDDNTFNWHKEVFTLYEGFRSEAIQANRNQIEARVLNTKTTLKLEKYQGDYKNEMLGNINVKVVNNELELNCNDFLNLTASHWHYDSFLSEKNNRFKMKILFNFQINQLGNIEELVFLGNKFTKISP
jgi:CubicO group peptidase (beta-lactamase class C family)